MRKSTILLVGIFVSLIALNLNAQTLPKTGAALKATETSIQITNGQSKTIEITRLRSKSFQKAKFGSIKVNSPEGLTATIKVDESNIDVFNIQLVAKDNIEDGKYTLVIQGEGRNASKVKATMLSIVVAPTSLAKLN